MTTDEDDEFGFSSEDEKELASLTSIVETSSRNRKRKASLSNGHKSAKRVAHNPDALPLAVKALTQNFGLQAFRLKQEPVISRILAGGSAVVIFPTGGGKSLCYQVPALIFSELDKLSNTRGEKESGITLVVSPLIALMKDQVDALIRRGIRAATFDSTNTRQEYLRTCEMLRNGELKLLYVAPERLNNEGFVEHMKHVRGGIRLLAVDEAHCISEWGHAFRPDYLKIARFVSEIKAERVICLTATATPRVAQDVCDAFGIEEAGLFRTSSYRSNLQLLAESAKTKQELYPRLFTFLRSNPGSTIVYVTLQKQTEELAKELRAQGFKARAFHAGMDTKDKMQLQDEFMTSNTLIMVATIAFGMGIDKDNIRNVIHFNIPSSLESYSQEIGRAGRDGKTSKCVFYVCGEDLHLREMFARGDLPARESIHKLLKDIFDPTNVRIPIGGEIKTAHYAQSKDFDIRPTILSSIYAQLELQYNLIRATTPVFTKYSFAATGRYKSMSENSAEVTAIKSYAKMAARLHHIDVATAAAKFGLLRMDIVRKLNEWNEQQIIDLKPSGILNVYRVTQPLPKNPADIEKLAEELYAFFLEREQQALDRAEAVLRLITNSDCYSKALAQHFGDDLQDGKKECGHCTWCLTHQAVIRQDPPPVKFDRAAFQAIMEAIPDRDDPRFLARVAFGISSPRATAMKLSKSPIFASMEDHEFSTLLDAFTKECIQSNPKRR
ncbi:hypothetical protein B7494_g163 [Chlorociboria aeruginascens]|nr:hypothetical protein B7494_g163 [Chlorociboria aeruginascens]